MSVRVVRGDLFRGAYNVLAHGCNCFCNMGAGVARRVAREYPAAVRADMATPRGARSKLGKFSRSAEKDGTLVYNLYTQYRYGPKSQQNVDYSALQRALERMRGDVEAQFSGRPDSPRIAMPMIGCGFGGGSWDKVRPIVEKTLRGMDVTVYHL